MPGAIGHCIAFKVPPCQRFDRRCLVGSEGSDLGPRQRSIVDASVFDGADKLRAGTCPDVPQPEHRNVVVDIQQVNVLRLVLGVRLAVTVDAHLVDPVDNRNLYQALVVGRLHGIAVLVSLSTSQIVATGHPFAASELTQHDGVKLIATLNRQHAATLLSQVCRQGPGDQSLVRGHRLFRGVRAFSGKSTE